MSWGVPDDGRLGIAPLPDDIVWLPTAVEGVPADPVQIACGDAFTAVLTASGELWAWGSNLDGQLGLGDDGDDECESPRRLLSGLGLSVAHLACGRPTWRRSTISARCGYGATASARRRDARRCRGRPPARRRRRGRRRRAEAGSGCAVVACGAGCVLAVSVTASASCGARAPRPPRPRRRWPRPRGAAASTRCRRRGCGCRGGRPRRAAAAARACHARLGGGLFGNSGTTFSPRRSEVDTYATLLPALARARRTTARASA